MTTVSNQINIDASPETVWQALADFGGINTFNPGIVGSRSLGDANSGIGAERRCDIDGKVHVLERITQWNEGESLTLEIYGGKGTPPFSHAFATIGVRPDGEGAVATAALDYSLKFGPFGRLLDRTMVRKQLGPAFGDILVGLKQYCESGQAVQAVTEDERRSLVPA